MGIQTADELHIHVENVSRLYTDATGGFPIRLRRGNQYIMVAYHCDTNLILTAPFKLRSNMHCMLAYNSIMQRLKDRIMLVDLQIMDNEASAEYKHFITAEWGVRYQLVPAHIHHHNAAKGSIRTFKAHFLAILTGVAADFPKYLWDLLLPQAELTLNLLRQATLNQAMLAWEHFQGVPFKYDATPLCLLGYPLMIHKKASTRHSWDF